MYRLPYTYQDALALQIDICNGELVGERHGEELFSISSSSPGMSKVSVMRLIAGLTRVV